MTRLFTPRNLFVLGACIILAIGMTSAISGPGNSMTAAESRGLIFEHALHEDMDCIDCHVKAETATAGTEDMLPGHPVCSDCHDTDDSGECSICHREGAPKGAPGVIDFSPKFDHEAHIKAELWCAECHTDLDAPLADGIAGHFPHMNDCMACHTTKLVGTDCNLCHLPEDDLVPDDHKLEWLTFHGIAAVESQTSCMQCHSIGDDCQACHNGDAVSSPHPRNYISRHGPDAHLSEMACGVCHEQRDFCVECHRTFNLLPGDHFRSGWVSASGGGHADAAQFDLESCMSCHDAPGSLPVCANCHGE